MHHFKKMILTAVAVISLAGCVSPEQIAAQNKQREERNAQMLKDIVKREEERKAQFNRSEVPIPADMNGRKKLFLKDGVMIFASKCGWLGDVSVVTGGKTGLIQSATRNMDLIEETISKDGTYNFWFNHKSMLFMYFIDKHKVSIYDGTGYIYCESALIKPNK